MSAFQRDLFGVREAALPPGFAVMRGRVARGEDVRLLDEVAEVLAAAPPYRLKMRTGAYVINRMTNCGEVGWHSDARGYRYVKLHPETGAPWPPIPPGLKRVAMAAAAGAGAPFEPDACLVNLYAEAGKMNLHQDRDETDFSWPIVSFSFGQDAVFALGGQSRRDKVQDVMLSHGDVVVMHGPARMLFHGVKKIVPGTSPLDHAAIPAGGRLNLTFRRAQ